MAERPEPRPQETEEVVDPDEVIEDDPVDEADRESFPASDAPSSWAGPPDP